MKLTPVRNRLAHEYKNLPDLTIEWGLVAFISAGKVIAIKNMATRQHETGCFIGWGRVRNWAKHLGATHVVISHSHPSGRLRPSGLDVHADMVRRLRSTMSGITILDNLIVSTHHTNQGEWYSFALSVWENAA